MDSIFEKITLYDILGYLLPGGVFVVLSAAYPLWHTWTEYSKQLESIKGCLILCLVVISYVVGVALSELSNILVRERHGDNKKIKEFLDSRKLNPSELINRSGIAAGGVKGDLPVDRCFEIMYADIQTDPDYKRIHNYASAEVMYKNMFMALAAGGIFWIAEGVWYGKFQECSPFFIVVTAIAAVLMRLYFTRWKRFYRKKVCYTFLWFEEKVSGREQSRKKGSRGRNG